MSEHNKHNEQPAPPPLPEGEPGSMWVGPLRFDFGWIAWEISNENVRDWHFEDGAEKWHCNGSILAHIGETQLARHVAKLQRERDEALDAPALLVRSERAEAQRDELLRACEEALESSVDATTYPDGPCLDSEVRDAMRTAIANARNNNESE